MQPAKDHLQELEQHMVEIRQQIAEAIAKRDSSWDNNYKDWYRQGAPELCRHVTPYKGVEDNRILTC